MPVVTNETELRAVIETATGGHADLDGGAITLTSKLTLPTDGRSSIVNGELNANMSSTMVEYIGSPTAPPNLWVHEASVSLRNLGLRNQGTGTCLRIEGGGKETGLMDVKVQCDGGIGCEIVSWDGGKIHNLAALKCGGPGVSIDRMHICDSDITSRQNAIGILASKVKGGRHQWYLESNSGWGLDGTDFQNTRLATWAENNNNPSSTSTGQAYSQARLRRSNALRFDGLDGRQNSQWDMDRGTRRNVYRGLNILSQACVDQDWWYRTEHSSSGDNNFNANWTSSTIPTVSEPSADGTSVTLTLPADVLTTSFQNWVGSNWYPFQSQARADQSPQLEDAFMEYTVVARCVNYNQAIEDWLQELQDNEVGNYPFTTNLNGFGIPWSAEERGTILSVPRSRDEYVMHGWAFVPAGGASTVGSLYFSIGRTQSDMTGRTPSPEMIFDLSLDQKEWYPT